MLKEMRAHGHVCVFVCVCAHASVCKCLCRCTHSDTMKDLWHWVVIMLQLHNHYIQRLLVKKKKDILVHCTVRQCIFLVKSLVRQPSD